MWIHSVGRFTSKEDTLCCGGGRLIVQAWSTSEWPKACPPSPLEFRLKPAKTGTELIMVQSGVPAAQSRNLRSGWAEYYWKPLRAWFAKSR
jgi:activator of HSP90 ATPase